MRDVDHRQTVHHALVTATLPNKMRVCPTMSVWLVGGPTFRQNLLDDLLQRRPSGPDKVIPKASLEAVRLAEILGLKVSPVRDQRRVDRGQLIHLELHYAASSKRSIASRPAGELTSFEITMGYHILPPWAVGT